MRRWERLGTHGRGTWGEIEIGVGAGPHLCRRTAGTGVSAFITRTIYFEDLVRLSRFYLSSSGSSVCFTGCRLSFRLAY
jgi:hypothetical protein